MGRDVAPSKPGRGLVIREKVKAFIAETENK